jgi:RHS repeat-associated protein
MLTATNYAGTVSFAYDNRNRRTSTTDVHGITLDYEYDGNGNRTLLKLGGQNHTGYVYDASNRLTTLTDETNENFTFGYDVADRLTTKTLPNNVATTYNYDGLSRISRLKHQSGTNTLVDDQYTYNSARQISQIAGLARTRTFTYDNLDRVTAATDTVLGNESYSYDDVGNRTASHLSSTYGYQPFNRLITNNGLTYDYDANGNRMSLSDGSMFPGGYVWDYENRLTGAANPGWSLGSASFSYDALGRLVGKTAYINWEKHTYDGLDVVLDQNNVDTVYNENGDGSIKYQNAPGIDNKLKQNQGGYENYFLADHLGSTVAATDSSGSIAGGEINYDSFGNPVATNGIGTRYLYTGREYEGYTGLYYYRARWYDPQLGRFISEDPIGFAGGDINLYAYVRNNPVNLKDPKGTAIVPILIVGTVAIAESYFHSYLASTAEGFFPNQIDPQGRKRHCYVNCVSIRYHLGSPVAPTAISVGQEVLGFVDAVAQAKPMDEFFADTAGDMRANMKGQSYGFLIGSNCEDLCKECQ